MIRILIVEDDPNIAKTITATLAVVGYGSDLCENGEDAVRLCAQNSYDLVLLDVMLPKLNGFTVIEELRAAGLKLPIIVLSAKDSVESKITGLEKGGDDYLAKPFSMAELIARVHAQLRRASCAAEPTVLTVEDLTLDLISRKVVRGGERIELQPLEYQLLEYLMRNKGRVVSKTTIMEHVWEYHFDTRTNIVESRVCRLREKIDKPFARKLIRTVRGFGYVLE